MKAVRINDITYRSMVEACDFYDLDCDRVTKYMDHHKCDFETAVLRYLAGMVYVGGRRTPVKFEKKRYPSITAACKDLEVTPPTMRKIMKQHNCSFQTAYYIFRHK